jgi:hypothetical protein
MRTLTTGTGAGSFALSAFWIFVMILRFITAVEDMFGSLGIIVLWGLPDVHRP